MKIEVETSQRPLFSWLGTTVLLLIAVGIISIVYVRSNAAHTDFATVNIQTIIVSLLCWLGLAYAFWSSRLPRSAWVATLLFPIVAGGVFFAFYRIKRVDGELRPQFVSRWSSDIQLPESPDIRLDTLSQSMLAPRETDSPQFLGPARTATFADSEIAPNWVEHPPVVRWKQPIGAGWSSFAIQGDIAITMEQRDEQEWITAYNILDGTLLWSCAIDSHHTNIVGGTGPRSTPAIFENRVYACTAVKTVVCLDITTGNQVWAHELHDISQEQFESSVSWGRSGSPLIVAGKIVLPLGGDAEAAQALIALDAEDGTTLWKAGTDQISYSSPALVTVANVPQIIYTSESKLASYSPEDGKELWSFDAPSASNGSPNVAQPILFDENKILLTKGYGTGAKVLEIAANEQGDWKAELVWKKTVLRTKFTSCVISNGFAFGLSDGILQCVDLASGQSRWKKGRYRHGQVLLVGKHLLISSESGELVLVDANPEKWIEIGKVDIIGDVTWNTPALSGNRLLMRNSDEAACVILPLVSHADTSISDDSPNPTAEQTQP